MAPPSHRLAVVLSHPVQYYSPWFRAIAASGQIDIRVFYLWDFGVRHQRDRQFDKAFRWDIDLLSGYDSEFVPNSARDPGTHHFTGLDNPLLTSRLATFAPSALLIFGYKWKSCLTALYWARRRGIPALLRGDSHWLGRGPPALGKRLVLQALFRQFAGFLTVGHANRDYYRSLGLPEARLHFAPHAVDADNFNPERPEVAAAAASLRRKLGLGERRTIVFAGKLLAKKQPLPLLEAFLEIAGPEDALVFVGDGEERDRLQRSAATCPDAVVRFLPFANQSEMPSRYLLGDIFVLPSQGHHETWGLAVNEAMHLGRPCIVSDLVGCQRDLVEPGVTGWVFPANDTASLRETLRRALAVDAPTLARMGRSAMARVASYNYERATEGLVAALRTIG